MNGTLLGAGRLQGGHCLRTEYFANMDLNQDLGNPLKGRHMQVRSPSGFEGILDLRWGSHVAHFFGSGDELRDILVPYFRIGLENNERCLWITGKAFNSDQARSALRTAVPDLDKRERAKQIDITNSEEWYSSVDKVRPNDLVNALLQREQDALNLGYTGLRVQGNCAWVSQDQWTDFMKYEGLVQEAVRGRRMICICSYCMEQMHNGAHLQVIEGHDRAMPIALRSPPRRRSLSGAAVDQTDLVVDGTEAHELLRKMERQKRTFDLAMLAAHMGTWRYTIADNVCVYDENAQRLYGLTEARFLHDEEGVKSKFHPDDLELMWSRVARALNAQGDGRYDVEYRVRQMDGSWRWLSAWGLVEFEGEGSNRKPIAIAGPPTKKGFGSRLLKLVIRDLDGDSRLSYDVSGLRCSMTAKI